MSAELHLEQVSARLGGKQVLRSVSATIAGGTLCCLLGPNGSGKTTLLRAITGYVALAGGSIAVGGRQLNPLTSRERAKVVALVPQLATPAGPLTVFEAAALGCLPATRGLGGMSAADIQYIHETLALLQLDNMSGRRCDELSGGEWRKVLVAQGIVQRASVLLLDEPTAFLDPPARDAILAAAKQLCTSHAVMVLAVLHDPLLAREYADTALLLRRGEVVFHGPVHAATQAERLAQLYANGQSSVVDGVPS
jgi:iron complex transport system ATP-binding protein